MEYKFCTAGDADPVTLQIQKACAEYKPTEEFPETFYKEVISKVILYRDTHIEFKLQKPEIIPEQAEIIRLIFNSYEENHKGKVSGMDAAMAHRERKQLNFSTIVDFSLLKQGIFFITLRHKISAET